VNGASPALAVIAAFFAAGEANVIAQRIEQRRAPIQCQSVNLPIHTEASFHGSAWICRRCDFLGGCGRRYKGRGGCCSNREKSATIYGALNHSFNSVELAFVILLIPVTGESSSLQHKNEIYFTKWN
jgi:hypothetical protein